MKKFTGNFLPGEHRFDNVLRKIGLSMVAILMLVGTAFSQTTPPSDDAQDTYYVLAETVKDCYRLDNDYEVQISMRDFVRIDSFNLVLTFDNNVFSYESVSDVHTQLAGMNVSASNGILTMNWDSGDDPQTIEQNNDTTDVFVLHFSVDGFKHSYNNVNNFVFSTGLNWSTASSVWNWDSSDQQSEILTWYIEDGSIEATQKWEEIVLDKSSASCDGSDAVVEVTTPANVAGMMYSFNGNTATVNPIADVVAPSTENTVEVTDATCTSYMERFDVDAASPLLYTTAETVFVDCAGGNGDIEIHANGGTPAYTYYIIPESDWAQVVEDFGQATNKDERNAVVAQYAKTNNVIERAPGVYWVAVQDANECIDLGIDLGWWTEVTVIDDVDPWDIVETAHVDEQCYDFNNGGFSMSFAGGTPSTDGYSIWVNSVLQADKSDTLVLTNLAPGVYDIVIQDSLHCTTETQVTILAKDAIEFEVGFTDASCDLDNGTLWIEPGTIAGGSGTYDYWVYSTLPDFSVADTIWDVMDTAMGLAPNVYYSRVFDSEGCFADYRNAQGDNAIKILSIDFSITSTEIMCNGEHSTATITVENPGNHKFMFNIDGGTWQASNIFEDLAAGTYTFGVHDTTIHCINYWSYTITEPDVLEVSILDLLTLEPTCHGATDGNIQVRGEGGEPFVNSGGDNYYEYKFDDRDWTAGSVDNTFATGTGLHTIIIRDANGCTASVEYELYLTPNVIEVQDYNLACNGDVTELTGEVVSWIQEPVGKAQGEREPVIYWSATTSVASDIVAEGNVFSPLATGVDAPLYEAGTYYFVAKDEWGCYSNVDEVHVTQPDAFVATATKVDDAGCYGTTDGKIIVEAWKGIRSDNCDLDSRYEYMLTQSADILNHPTWWNQVNWSDFQNDDAANDSVMVIDVQKGTYYIAVRDCCAKDGRPDLIQGPFTVVVDGADSLDIDWNAVTITNNGCYGDSNGSVAGLLEATTGGWGDYIFTIGGTTLPADYPTENMTGIFGNLPAGHYSITVEDDSLGCVLTDWFDITEPDMLGLDTEIAYVSCNGLHDGVIRFMISGGTAPFQETTNNVGEYDAIEDIPDAQWYSIDDRVYDRRFRAGVYVTWIKDANGCITGPDTTVILQPEELALEVVKEIEPTCNGGDGANNNGEIWVVPTGGWNSAADNYMYTVTLGSTSYVVDLGDTVKFTGLTASSHSITIWEHNSSIISEPIITDPDYFLNWTNGDYNYQLPWQNSDAGCVTTIDVDLAGPDPIDYENIDFYDVICYNTATGVIDLQNITGGTMPYTVWVEGPLAYRPDNGGVGEEILLVDGTTYLNNYKWDDLVWGHYTIFIKDANDCQIVKESGEIGNPDSLMIVNTELIENALCNGSKGTIKVHAEGGVGGYMYAVSPSLVPMDGTHPFPPEDLVWQESATFEVTAATYTSWVKDANGCVQGWATDLEATPILQHRVTVSEPDLVVISDTDSEDTQCYESTDGTITYTGLMGGNGPDYTAVVTAEDGTQKVYTQLTTPDGTLSGLGAGTYTIVFHDYEGCPSVEYTQVVNQPEEFVIELTRDQDAFICHDDLAGIFEIKVISGGTPFGYNGPGEYENPIYEYKWHVYTDAEHTDEVDSLFGAWGFTSTFQGYAGYYYVAYGRDANGCVTEGAETYVEAPELITFDLKKLTCFGDEMASARVVATGTTDRQFQVEYKEIENDVVPDDWTVYNGWFNDSIDMMDAFTFDNEDAPDYHYLVRVRDDQGCTSDVQSISFDRVQTVLAVSSFITAPGECTSEVEISVSGGTPPYVVTVDGDVVTDLTLTLDAGTHEIVVTDAHLICVAEETLEVPADPVTIEDAITTFIGKEVHYTNEEADVDTMLAGGVHTIPYLSENGCMRTLIVTVEEIPQTLGISQIQGNMESSPIVGEIVKTSGTVTAIAGGEGFFIQDENAAWGGIWIEYSDVDGAGIIVGNGIEVVGQVAEIANVTSIIPTEVTPVAATLIVVPVVVNNPVDVASEKFESVLVQVAGARAMDYDSPTGEWTIMYTEGDDATVNNWLFDPTVTVGDFYNVTGIVNGRLDAFKLEPRKIADVENITNTAIEDLEGIEFKVYPNPFNDRIMIDNNDKLTRVVVSNIAGQRVIDVEYPSHEIRTANLVSGVYVVSMFTESGIAKTERIVKR